MVKKDFKSLSDNAILRLLALKNGFCIVTYLGPDVEVQELINDGYIKEIENSIFYEFTEEGEKLTDEFWDRYINVISEEVKSKGANFFAYADIVKKTGLSYRVVGEMARYLEIRFIP